VAACGPGFMLFTIAYERATAGFNGFQEVIDFGVHIVGGEKRQRRENEER